MPRGPKRRLTQVSLNRGMKNEYQTLHSQYTGYHSRTIQMVVKKKVADRKSQFLTHLATALKAWIAEVSSGTEIEIQIAIYNESCVIISSNKNETATFMYSEFVKEQASKFLTYLKGVARLAVKRAVRSTADDSGRIERHSTKLAHELVSKRDVGLPMLDELEGEGKDICVSFDASADIGESFANFLNRSGEMAGKFVAVVTASGVEAHAEQKIMLALCKAALHLDRTAPLVVAGTFRPCRGCYESLSVVRKYAFPNLQFGVRPGHFWRTTTQQHLQIVDILRNGGFISPSQIANDFDVHGRLVGLTDTTHRPVIRTRRHTDEDALHYATDSDSEADSDD